MKKYKVGDTIYVKGKVKAIDNTALPYCVDFGNGNNFIDFESGTVWVTSDNMIDELPTAEPVKPVLPKKVADEISLAKFIGVTFDHYIVRQLTSSDYKDSATYKMIQSPDVQNVIEVLLNAWNNGYTVGTEKKYNVKVPHTKDAWYYISWNSDLRTVTGKEICSDFTESEIERYGLQDFEREEVK